MTAKQYRIMMWVTVILIFVTPLIEPVELGWGLGLLALFLLYMGFKLDNKNKQ